MDIVQSARDIVYGSIMPYRFPTVIRHEEEAKTLPLKGRPLLEQLVIAGIVVASLCGQYKLLDNLSEHTHYAWWAPVAILNAVSAAYEGAIGIKKFIQKNIIYSTEERLAEDKLIMPIGARKFRDENIKKEI